MTPSVSGLESVQIVAASGSTAYIDVAAGTRQRMYVTTDGGAHVRPVTAPTVAAAKNSTAVARLVFPTARIGYAVLGEIDDPASVMLVTTDGAVTWQRVALPASAGGINVVAGHGNRVYAATLTCSPTSCSNLQVWSVATGATRFARITGSLPTRATSGGLGMTGWGASLWLMLGVGSTQDPVTARSTDGGASFTTSPGPQGIACRPEATSRQVMWTSCSSGMLMDFQRTSGDQSPVTLPVNGSGTGGTFLDPVSDTVAFFGTQGGRWSGLYLTRDGGRHFTKVSNGPPGYLSSGVSPSITFLTPTTGLAVGDHDVLYRTTDSGATWHAIATLTG